VRAGDGADGALAHGQGLLAGGAQAFGHVIGQIGLTGAQAGSDLAAETVGNTFGGDAGGHNSIPLAFSALLRVWMARKQWVLTLPSEQPMAAAVSATSISPSNA
jgi:hypothetical protein